jgi:signal recognition particle subunit SEC65
VNLDRSTIYCPEKKIPMASTSSNQAGVLGRGQTIAGCGAETATEEQYSRWKCIYPNYIDACKFPKEGRKISLKQAVERPVLGEMIEICQKHNIPYVVENKAYSRDWLIRGRLRLNLSSITDESLNSSMTMYFMS